MDDFQQAARIGPDGLVIGPNKVSSDVNRAADQAQGTLGINNLKVGPDGITVNDGNRLNSTVQVCISDQSLSKILGGLPLIMYAAGGDLRLCKPVTAWARHA